MIQLTSYGVFLDKTGSVYRGDLYAQEDIEQGRKRTMAFQILNAHNSGSDYRKLRLKFDSLVSPDNNYVSILQTARASGLTRFPVPYVLSNCHHTLCAIGGSINEDDHVFGLGNAEKYGGIFVPPYRAVLHQYMRETMAGCGKMILGSDSHTRYGALGTMGIGEGGGEVVKQLLGHTYDIQYPSVIAVWLTGSPRPGVGPQDVALALIAATFESGFSKNKVLEFTGPGVSILSMEYRIGIDVMTTESAALSSIWRTDEKTKEYLRIHGREEDFKIMEQESMAYYDGLIRLDLSKVECMIALPFHPSNAVSIREFQEHAVQLLEQVEKEGQEIKGAQGKPFSLMSHLKNGKLYVDQALISGCSGGMFENISAVADILRGSHIGANGVSLGINPSSLPVMSELMRQGIAGELTLCGATLRPAFCGPCFGVTDVPANDQVSIRHTTRNYPNREGTKPRQGQMAAVFLMDARSIAASVRNGGRLTAATELEVSYTSRSYVFERSIYQKQVFYNFGKGKPDKELKLGPNIADWPEMSPLGQHLLLQVAGSYHGSVTTDELVPSGDASSYRSNPEKISDYTLLSRDEGYRERAKIIRKLENERKYGTSSSETLNQLLRNIAHRIGNFEYITFGSVIVSQKIGDGSSREQAASNQKVLGGFANLANEYSTKRYRSNLINWGILPFRTSETLDLKNGDYLFVKNILNILRSGQETIKIEVLEGESGAVEKEIVCTLDSLTKEEREILCCGCLINYYKCSRE